MATAARSRVSAIFLVAVLVGSSCFADVAYGAGTAGTIAIRSLLADAIDGNVITTLELETAVSIACRKQGRIVYDDPWWLLVQVPSLNYIPGWLPDYNVVCPGTIGNCNVPSC